MATNFAKIVAGLVGAPRNIAPNFYTPAASAGVGLSSPSSLYGAAPAPAPFAAAPPATGSPSAFYGVPQATGSPSAFYGTAPAAPAAKPTVKPAGRFPSASPTAAKPYAGLTDQQIRTQAASVVDAELAPLLARIKGLADSQSQAGQAAIGAYTKEFGPDLAQLAGINTAGLESGVAGQSAIDDAVYKALTGAGGSAADELAGKLAQINAPTNAVDATRGLGTGAANAALASGSASLSALNTRLADAKTVAGGQKGLAADFGLQALTGLESQIQGNRANQALQVESQRPSLIQSAATDLRGQQPKTFSLTPGQTEFVPDGKGGYATVTAPAKPTTPQAPKVVQTSKGTLAWDPATGRWSVLAPPKPAASAAVKPPAGFKLGPGQVEYVPDGKGGYVPVQGPPKTAAAPRPIVVGSAQTGWNVVNPTTGKVLATMNGAAPKPTITGSAQTGWIARDPQTGKTLWTQAGAPTPAAKVAPTSLAPTSKYIVDTTGKTLGANPNYAGPKPAPTSAMKQGLAALAAAGGVNWQTGALTPTFRKAARAYITKTTGTDPGPLAPTLSKDELARLEKNLGVTPTAPKPQTTRVTGTGPGSKYEIDPATGRPVRANPNYVPPAAKPNSKQQPSYTDITKAKADAADSARDAYNGVPDNIVKVVENGSVVAKNEPIPKRSYTDAKKDLIAHGIPENIAVAALNRYYKPGERGRPATTSDYLRDKAIIWQRDAQGNVVAYRVFNNKNGTQRRQALGTISPQDPNYKAALARARQVAA